MCKVFEVLRIPRKHVTAREVSFIRNFQYIGVFLQYTVTHTEIDLKVNTPTYSWPVLQEEEEVYFIFATTLSQVFTGIK